MAVDIWADTPEADPNYNEDLYQQQQDAEQATNANPDGDWFTENAPPPPWEGARLNANGGWSTQPNVTWDQALAAVRQKYPGLADQDVATVTKQIMEQASGIDRYRGDFAQALADDQQGPLALHRAEQIAAGRQPEMGDAPLAKSLGLTPPGGDDQVVGIEPWLQDQDPTNDTGPGASPPPKGPPAPDPTDPSFGAPPDPFGETYTTPTRPGELAQPYQAPTWQGGEFQAPTLPGSLQQPYQAPTWQGGEFTTPETPAHLQQPYQAQAWQGGDFVAPTKPGVLQQPYMAPDRPAQLQQPFTAPTAADLQTDPGYQARLDAALKASQRSAAARGSILSGGTQVALGREQQTLASNEYGNLYNRALATRQQQEGEYGNRVGQSLATRGQQVGEYQQDYGNAAGEYQQRYGQHLDANHLGLQARQQQVGEQQTNVGNALTQYQQRFGQFQTLANQGLEARNQNLGEYQTNYGNAWNQYQQRYGQFQDAAAMGLQARNTNEAAYQTDVGHAQNQYLNRFNAHQTHALNRRNAETDLWQRHMDLQRNALTAAGLARPGG